MRTMQLRRITVWSTVAVTMGAAAGSAFGEDGAAGSCSAVWSTDFAGSGIDGSVADLMAYTEHDGRAALYVGGEFTSAGGIPAQNVARFDGSLWSALGEGVPPVLDLHHYDFGQGEHVLATGWWVTDQVRQWTGRAWIPGPPGLPPGGKTNMGTYQGQLIVSGSFSLQDSSYIVRWDGSQWTGMPPGLGSVLHDQLTVELDGREVHVVAGLPAIMSIPAAVTVAIWDGSTWSGMGSLTGLTGGPGRALAVFDDGSGPTLHLGGGFTHSEWGPIKYMARWKDGAWSQVGASFDGRVHALAVFDDGTGPALYAGGAFTHSGDVEVRGIARWRGGPDAAWEPVGGGVFGTVKVLEVFDADGPGPMPPALYVGGDFTMVDGMPANRIARWGRPCPVQPCHGDMDGSGAVDGSDLATLLGQWGTTGCGAEASCAADLDGSGSVDGGDLALLLGAWGPCGG